MTARDRFSPTGFGPRAAIAFALALVATSTLAQFKVIGPDGKVTYTDREPTSTEGKVVPLGGRAVAAAAAEPELPFELRQPMSKYPVTLYVTSTACDPCVSARQMLKQRGIPFNERMVVSAEDSEALERLSGAREAPTLTIGAQTLRGFAAEVWVSYLDAAGYPRESRLPASYQYRPATPIVDRRESTTARSDARPEARPAPTAPAAPSPSGIRF
ncbi:MAG: glutaredoxin family protein [Caldimonas sp.]